MTTNTESATVMELIACDDCGRAWRTAVTADTACACGSTTLTTLDLAEGARQVAASVAEFVRDHAPALRRLEAAVAAGSDDTTFEAVRRSSGLEAAQNSLAVAGWLLAQLVDGIGEYYGDDPAASGEREVVTTTVRTVRDWQADHTAPYLVEVDAVAARGA